MPKKSSKLVFSTRENAEYPTKNKSKISQSLPPQQQTIYVSLDRKRRRGKTVTVAQGFQLTTADLKALQKI